MLSQLNLNLAGDRRRPGPCWTWELDPAEGTVGWMPDGQSLPGNLNQLYTTDFAERGSIFFIAIFRCMPVPWTNSQAQGASKTFKYPEMFRYSASRLVGSISALPTACLLHGYERAGTPNDRLGEAVISSAGTSIRRGGHFEYRHVHTRAIHRHAVGDGEIEPT